MQNIMQYQWNKKKTDTGRNLSDSTCGQCVIHSCTYCIYMHRQLIEYQEYRINCRSIKELLDSLYTLTLQPAMSLKCRKHVQSRVKSMYRCGLFPICSVCTVCLIARLCLGDGMTMQQHHYLFKLMFWLHVLLFIIALVQNYNCVL